MTAHVGWGTVLVPEASPLVPQWPLSGWGRAGVLCTVEQDESKMVASPEGGLTVPFPPHSSAHLGAVKFVPTPGPAEPPWQAWGGESRLCHSSVPWWLLPHGIIPGL